MIQMRKPVLQARRRKTGILYATRSSWKNTIINKIAVEDFVRTKAYFRLFKWQQIELPATSDRGVEVAGG